MAEHDKATSQTEPPVDDEPPGAEPSPKPVRRSMRLGVVVPLAAATILAGAVLGSAIISERNARRLLVRELEARLVLESRNLALSGAGALLGAFPELSLQPLIREMLADRPELHFAVVVDHEGVIRGSVGSKQLGQPYLPPADLAEATPSAPAKPGERLLTNHSLLVAESPIVHSKGKRLGTAIVGMRRGYLESAIREARQGQAFLLTLVLVIGGLVTLVLIWLLLRPVSLLRRGLDRIGSGDLDTRLEINDRTELGLLAESVNHMAAQLKVAQRETLEQHRLASRPTCW
jgi:HAMP domain-containing protein